MTHANIPNDCEPRVTPFALSSAPLSCELYTKRQGCTRCVFGFVSHVFCSLCSSNRSTYAKTVKSTPRIEKLTIPFWLQTANKRRFFGERGQLERNLPQFCLSETPLGFGSGRLLEYFPLLFPDFKEEEIKKTTGKIAEP